MRERCKSQKSPFRSVLPQLTIPTFFCTQQNASWRSDILGCDSSILEATIPMVIRIAVTGRHIWPSETIGISIAAGSTFFPRINFFQGWSQIITCNVFADSNALVNWKAKTLMNFEYSLWKQEIFKNRWSTEEKKISRKNDDARILMRETIFNPFTWNVNKSKRKERKKTKRVNHL